MAFVHHPPFICTLNIFNGRHCLLRMVIEICFCSIHIMWIYPSVTVSWFHFEKPLSQCTCPVVLMGMTIIPDMRMVDIRPKSGKSGHLIHKETLIG